jgi:hypothetical protein
MGTVSILQTSQNTFLSLKQTSVIKQMIMTYAAVFWPSHAVAGNLSTAEIPTFYSTSDKETHHDSMVI